MNLLEGVRVVSFNHFLMGPQGAMALADLGADVIAVEPLAGAFQRNWAVGNLFVDGHSINHLNVGRNKRSIAVDLKSAEGKEAVRRLIARADVLMENFRPGTMEKLGFGYEDMRRLNPGLIYARATGYGGDGPYRDRPGQDLLVQALSGIAASTGTEDGPPTPVGPTVVDHHGAALYAMGILAALFARQRTGEGRLVEVDLFSAALDLQIEALGCFLNGGRQEAPRAPANIAAWFSPAPYGIYRTRDGHVALSMTTLRALGEALDLPEVAAMAQDEAFVRRAEIAATVQARLAGETTEHWLEVLEAHQIWHARVQDYRDLLEDPQVRHNGSFVAAEMDDGTHVRMVGHPVRYDGRAPEVRLAPQPLGAQSREILGELGYAPDELDRLFADGIFKSDGPGGA